MTVFEGQLLVLPELKH